jgi:site-specific DNA-methyltransferase (adenine-specific)
MCFKGKEMQIEELENKIINADCMNILKQLPDKCIDLVLTDPPYGINIEKMSFTRDIKGGVAQRNDYSNCFQDIKISKEHFEQMVRVSKNQIIFGGNYYTDYLQSTQSWICWNKKGDGRFSNDFADGELAWTSFNKPLKIYHFLWSGMMQENMSNKEKRIHPTQKPTGLFELILNDFSKENDLVLDCFSGSGTTAIACSELKRRFICIEKDKEYWQKSIERLENYNKQLKLF